LNCGQIKTGSASRSDRMAKYNQLLRIEEELVIQLPGIKALNKIIFCVLNLLRAIRIDGFFLLKFNKFIVDFSLIHVLILRFGKLLNILLPKYYVKTAILDIDGKSMNFLL
jgi:hypothetical protein